jgi:hypothetical protein
MFLILVHFNLNFPFLTFSGAEFLVNIKELNFLPTIFSVHLFQHILQQQQKIFDKLDKIFEWESHAFIPPDGKCEVQYILCYKIAAHSTWKQQWRAVVVDTFSCHQMALRILLCQKVYKLRTVE